MRPRHRQTGFKAVREFTDRLDARELFETSLTSQQGLDDYRVLNWYGVGGQGKSALSREFVRMYQALKDQQKKNSRVFAAARYEFPKHQVINAADVLFDLSLKLRKETKLDFQNFDLAYSRYFMLSNPGKDIRQIYSGHFKKGDSELLDDLVELSEGGIGEIAVDAFSALIPGLNILVKYSNRLRKKTLAWFQERGKKQLLGLDALSTEELLHMLPQYFGMDICHNLEKKPKLRLCVLLDNYESLWSLSQFNTLSVASYSQDTWVRELIEESPGVLYVITGRDKLPWAAIRRDWGDILDCHLLGHLSDADAQAFLRKVPIAEEAIITKVVQSCGGLPFYLDLQVSLYETEKCHSPDTSPDPELFGGTHPEILARFINHLDSNEFNALRLCSYPDEFDEALLYQIADNMPGGTGPIDWQQLTERSFISETEDKQYAMHALMRDYIQKQEVQQRTEAFRRIHTHLYEFYAAKIPSIISEINFQNSRYFLSAVRHAEWAGLNKKPDTAELSISKSYFKWRNTAEELLSQAAQYRTLEIFLTDQLQRDTDTLGPEHPDTLTTRHNLAQQWGHLGLHQQAAAAFAEILAIRERPDGLGPEHPYTLSTRANLAYQWGQLGQHQQAADAFAEILAIRERPDGLGPEHPQTLATRANLAQQWGYLGQHQQAADTFAEILAIRERPDGLGPEHPQTLATRHNLAYEWGQLGLHQQAADAIAEILAIQARPDVLGPEHPYTLNTRTNLARQWGQLGQHQQAAAAFAEILAIQERPDVLGPEHPQTLTTRQNLAYEWGQLGLHQQAAAALAEILAIQARPDVLGPEHPYTLNTRHNLARQWGQLGLHQQAAAALAEVLAIEARPDVLGPEHPQTLTTRANLAQQWGYLGQHQQAADAFAEILAIRERPDGLGPEHPSTLTTRNNLAYEWGRLGLHQQAAAAFAEVLAIRERPDVLGPEHPNTLITRFRLAEQLSELGNHQQAAEAYKAVLAIRERPDVLGPEHPDTLITRFRLAEQLSELGNHQQAAEAFAAVLSIEERPDKLGSEHPDTLVTRTYLALEWGKLGRTNDAVKELTEVWHIQKRADVLGPEHMDTLVTYQRLAYFLEELGRPQEARDALAELLPILEKNDVLGPEHPTSIQTRKDLATLQARLSEHQTKDEG